MIRIVSNEPMLAMWRPLIAEDAIRGGEIAYAWVCVMIKRMSSPVRRESSAPTCPPIIPALCLIPRIAPWPLSILLRTSWAVSLNVGVLESRTMCSRISITHICFRGPLSGSKTVIPDFELFSQSLHAVLFPFSDELVRLSHVDVGVCGVDQTNRFHDHPDHVLTRH